MIMAMNVTDCLNPYEKGRADVTAFSILVISMFFGLMSAASGAYGQETGQNGHHGTEPLASKPVSIDAYEKLLREADELVKKGKPAEAYALLEPLEFDHSGEERFDYLIGIAALDSGKPDRATLAFERVLMVNPNSVAARLDMARAYYQLGDVPRAKTEFTTSLQQDPSEVARANIERYLDEIAVQEKAKQTTFAGYVEGTVGHDSNVNNSTNQSQIFVDAIAAIVALDPTNVKASDSYYGIAAGAEATHRLDANWSIYAGADLHERGYRTEKGFDSLGLDVRLGMTFGAQAERIRVGAMAGEYTLGSSRNSDLTGLNAEWNHVFSPSNQLKAFGQYAQYRYVDPLMQPNDFDQQVVGVGWSHVLAGGRSMLLGNLYGGTEKDVSALIAPPANPDGGRTDGAKRLWGLRVGGQTTCNDKMTLFANAGAQNGDYEKVNYYFQRQRSDHLYDLTAGANWRWNKLWALRPQLNYSKNDSNIIIYRYERMDVSLTIRRDFP